MIRTGIGVLAAAALGLAAVPAGTVEPASAQQKTVKIGFISTFSGPTAAIGNDMRNSFELGARSSRPQDRRPAGRGHLRGRSAQARSRRAEDPEADRVRQGRLHRRLYLVERAAGLAQAARRFEDHDGRRPMPAPSQLAGELCSPYVFSTSWQNDQTPGRDGPLHEPEGRQVGLPDRSRTTPPARTCWPACKITFKGRSSARN